MATFVLVHGGGHGGWCYKKVARLLRDAGHEVYTPTLTGLGERKHLLTVDTGLYTHITDIVNTLEYEDLRDVILVGHSYGGMVITGVSDLAADRIRELVYLDAAHPENGESLYDTAPASMDFARSSSQTIDGVELVMWPNEMTVAAMGVTDPDDLEELKSKMMPHPWKAFEEPIRFQNGDAGPSLPRTNVNCGVHVRGYSERDAARQLNGHRNYEIETGHDLMITEPKRVTEILLEVAQSASVREPELTTALA